jgi:hypothetical protein
MLNDRRMERDPSPVGDGGAEVIVRLLRLQDLLTGGGDFDP